MAGLFDFNYQDPNQVGQMAFGAGMLDAAGPSKMPVSVGQALARAMMARQQAAMQVAEAQRRNALNDATIQKMQADAGYRKLLAEKGIMPDTPAAVQVYEYWKKLSPEEQYAFSATQRGAVSKVINGIVHEWMGPQIGWVPQTTVQKESEAQSTIAQGQAYGTGIGRAATTPKEVWRNGQPGYATELDIMRENGLLGNAPRLGGLGGGMPPPIGNPMPNFQRVPQPQPQQPQPAAPPPVDYPATPQGIRQLGESIVSGQTPITDGPAPVAAGPQTGAIQPPSAGAAVLAGEREKEVEKEKLRAKRNADYPRAKGALNSLKDSTERGLKLIEKLEKSPGAFWNTGLLSNIPVRLIKGTDAYDDETMQMQPLRDKVVIETMKQLKELSSTGATGFGQLSEKEGTRLENAIAGLQVGGSDKVRAENLATVKDALKTIQLRAEQIFDEEFKEQELGALRGKYLKKD
jgi:hypothetical protein